MIERVITLVLTPMKHSNYALIVTIKVCERGKGSTEAMTLMFLRKGRMYTI